MWQVATVITANHASQCSDKQFNDTPTYPILARIAIVQDTGPTVGDVLPEVHLIITLELREALLNGGLKASDGCDLVSDTAQSFCFKCSHAEPSTNRQFSWRKRKS